MNKRTFCSLLATLSLSFSCSSALAAPPNDAWAYARDSIDAFYEIYAATSVHDKPPANLDNLTEFNSYLSKQMDANIAASLGFKRARAVLDSYSHSTDSSINFSFAALSGALISFSASYDNITDVLESELSKSPEQTMSSLGTFRRQIKEASQTTNEAWDFYVKMSVTVSNVLLEQTMSDLMKLKQEDMNKPASPYLRISSWQRDDLKQHILDKFGLGIATTSIGELPKNQLSARLLLDFLNDKWKTHN